MKESPQERKQRIRDTFRLIKAIEKSIENFNEDLNAETEFLKKALLLFQIGAWEESEEVSFYLHDSWYNALGIGYNEVVTLENYYECIDDPAERDRIMRSKEAFKKKPKGTLWQEQFTICGKRIHSFACIYANKMVVGGDLPVNHKILDITTQIK